MEIKQIYTFNLITKEELKKSEIYDQVLGDGSDNDTGMWDKYASEAIYTTSVLADWLSGNQLCQYLKEHPDYDYSALKLAVVKHCLHLLRMGVDYARGQSSYSLGTVSYSTTNPEDPLYIVPELVATLQAMGFLAKQFITNVKQVPTNNYGDFWTEDNRELRYINWNEANAFYTRYDRMKDTDFIKTHKDIENVYKPKLVISLDYEKLKETLLNDKDFVERIKGDNKNEF